MESKLSDQENFNLLGDDRNETIEELKKYSNKELLKYLNNKIMNDQGKAKFLSYFYPNGFTENLKPNEFYSVGIIEHICYFPMCMSSNYIATADSLQGMGYNYWRRIKGDGNCYYRSVLINYLEILILYADELKDPGIFFGLIKDLFFTQFPSKSEMAKMNTLLSLLFMLESLAVEKNVNKCFDMLYRCYNKSDVIEKTLIQWLRLKLADFLKANLDFEVNGIKLIQLIPGFELEDDLTYDPKKVLKYIDIELNRMNEFVEGYPLYITPLLLDLDINIYYIDESKTYKAIPIDIQYENNVKSLINPIENYLYRFNGCKYTINTLFRVPHYDTIYTGIFVEDLIRKYKNEDACLQPMAMNEEEYDKYKDSIYTTKRNINKARNPLTVLLDKNNTNNTNNTHIVIDINNINDEPTSKTAAQKDKNKTTNINEINCYVCIICFKESKISELITTQCDDHVCKNCFEQHINDILKDLRLKTKLKVEETPSDKIIETLKQFKVKNIKCFNQECHIKMEYKELREILEENFQKGKKRTESTQGKAALGIDLRRRSNFKKFCERCNKNEFITLIHGCEVCRYCQRQLIKFENKGKIVVLLGDGTAKVNRCCLCDYTLVEIDDSESLFMKNELQRNMIS
jgi:hypothetical protein